jgi:hypothetical protein
MELLSSWRTDIQVASSAPHASAPRGECMPLTARRTSDLDPELTHSREYFVHVILAYEVPSDPAKPSKWVTSGLRRTIIQYRPERNASGPSP